MDNTEELSFQKCQPSFSHFHFCEGIFVCLFLDSCLTQVKDIFVVFCLCLFWSKYLWVKAKVSFTGKHFSTTEHMKNMKESIFSQEIFHLVFSPICLLFHASFSLHNSINVTGILSCQWSKLSMKKGLGGKGTVKVPFAALWCWQCLWCIGICLPTHGLEEGSHYPGIRGT